ncbi:uncharacterized protein [Littorina saxatilis]|uniref:uncharacterized protein n=1 Tax=Littorina saxatilis TaxID=31220 RepID=UPI0038B52F1D
MSESKMAEPDIQPMSAEDVLASKPPPSYEEAMGQFVTSVKETQDESPPLSYIDIMPRMTDQGNMKNNMPPAFEKFSDIMRGANMWLQSNPALRVWKCETVERKVELGPVVHLDSTLHHESSGGANVYVFGVRLWLTRRTDPKEDIQELCLLNVPPPVKEIPVTIGHCGPFMGMGMGMEGMGMYPVMHFGRLGRRRMMVTQGMIQTYEGLSKACDSYNEATKADPLDGSILNVETTPVKFGDRFSGREADPDVTSWSESGKSGKLFSTKRFTNILRVFYVKGPPRHETLNMQTFLPKVLREPEWNRSAQFDTFDGVLAQTQQWLQSQSGVRVVSIETRDTEFHAGFGQPVVFNEDSADDIITSIKDRNLVHYLRVFYVSAPDATSYGSTALTSRLFVPIGTGGRRFETMTQTMDHINAWLSVVGQPLFSVETVPLLLTAGNRVDTSKADYKHTSRVGNYWLTCVRLYFPTPFQEPPPSALPASQSSHGQQSSSCRIL